MSPSRGVLDILHPCFPRVSGDEPLFGLASDSTVIVFPA